MTSNTAEAHVAPAIQHLERHRDDLAGGLRRLASKREHLVSEITRIDEKIVENTNEHAAAVTAIAHLKGERTVQMPVTLNYRPASDPYLRNPFTGAPDVASSDPQGHLLEAACQLGGMEYLDADLTVVSFTTEGLLNFLAALGVEGAA